MRLSCQYALHTPSLVKQQHQNHLQVSWLVVLCHYSTNNISTFIAYSWCKWRCEQEKRIKVSLCCILVTKRPCSNLKSQLLDCSTCIGQTGSLKQSMCVRQTRTCHKWYTRVHRQMEVKPWQSTGWWSWRLMLWGGHWTECFHWMTDMLHRQIQSDHIQLSATSRVTRNCQPSNQELKDRHSDTQLYIQLFDEFTSFTIFLHSKQTIHQHDSHTWHFPRPKTNSLLHTTYWKYCISYYYYYSPAN